MPDRALIVKHPPFRDAGAYIRERVWHPSQVLHQRRDGSLEMRIETSGHKELVRWVLSWMPDVEVLAPQSLHDRVREKLREALGVAR